MRSGRFCMVAEQVTFSPFVGEKVFLCPLSGTLNVNRETLTEEARAFNG